MSQAKNILLASVAILQVSKYFDVNKICDKMYPCPMGGFREQTAFERTEKYDGSGYREYKESLQGIYTTYFDNAISEIRSLKLDVLQTRPTSLDLQLQSPLAFGKGSPTPLDSPKNILHYPSTTALDSPNNFLPYPPPTSLESPINMLLYTPRTPLDSTITTLPYPPATAFDSAPYTSLLNQDILNSSSGNNENTEIGWNLT